MLRVYVDEAGDRGFSATASDYFIMSAIVVDDAIRASLQGRLAAIRNRSGKPSGTVLHFAKNLRDHGQRVYVCQEIGGVNGLTIVNVVLCKRHLAGAPLLTTDPQAVYLYTLRFTLERVSWLARDRGEPAIITFAHITRFQYANLRNYIARLKTMATSIEWSWVQSIRINHPQSLELLQVADIAASATRKAFEPDAYGVTEQRYLMELAPRLYRRPPGLTTSYGMKMHPASAIAHHPWVGAL